MRLLPSVPTVVANSSVLPDPLTVTICCCVAVDPTGEKTYAPNVAAVGAGVGAGEGGVGPMGNTGLVTEELESQEVCPTTKDPSATLTLVPKQCFARASLAVTLRACVQVVAERVNM